MPLAYDPAENERFWERVRQLPGFPHGEEICLRYMLIESNALFRIKETLNFIGVREERPLVVVMDTTPMRRGEDDLKPLVLSVLKQAGWEVETCILQPDSSGQVHTDMPHILQVKEHLGAEKAVVSVGSGVVTDIAKHACYLFDQEHGAHLPYLVYQTANSVSAYTSNMAPTLIEGVKRTLTSRYPDALICDLETLRDAPREMTIAGVGDLLAVFVSLADWYLAYRLGMDETWTPLPELLMGPLDELLVQNAEGIRHSSLEAMALLAKLITLGGIAMSLSHATAPLSGFEHILSHTLDLQNEVRGKAMALHGTQIALATVLGAAAYHIFLERFDPKQLNCEHCYPEPESMHKLILQTFHPLDPTDRAGEECWSDYRIKLEKWFSVREKLPAFLDQWEEIRPEVAKRTRPPEQIRKMFAAVEGPTRFSELEPPFEEVEVRFAFLNAPLIRKRFTIGDLFIWFNWDREALWREVWETTQSTLEH
ncbi:MAG: iron-containing alcohol dehydrogenase [Anaerolineales bacterium]|nr:iron-containing alcohol dehydrogenase [Anaerolineales bacterium]